jgi:hypothetical protein
MGRYLDIIEAESTNRQYDKSDQNDKSRLMRVPEHEAVCNFTIKAPGCGFQGSATTPTPGGAAAVSTPIKYTRRRALASTPPTGPLTDGQQGPLAFLYSVLRDGRVERGAPLPERVSGPSQRPLNSCESNTPSSGCNGQGWSPIQCVQGVGTTREECSAMPIGRPIMRPLWGAVEGTCRQANYEGHSVRIHRQAGSGCRA